MFDGNCIRDPLQQCYATCRTIRDKIRAAYEQCRVIQSMNVAPWTRREGRAFSIHSK